MTKEWGYVLLFISIIGIWFVGDLRKDLTTEYIHNGDGVILHDGPPLNQGGSWRRVNQELTPWEIKNNKVTYLGYFIVILFLLSLYIIFKYS